MGRRATPCSTNRTQFRIVPWSPTRKWIPISLINQLREGTWSKGGRWIRTEQRRARLMRKERMFWPTKSPLRTVVKISSKNPNLRGFTPRYNPARRSPITWLSTLLRTRSQSRMSQRTRSLWEMIIRRTNKSPLSSNIPKASPKTTMSRQTVRISRTIARSTMRETTSLITTISTCLAAVGVAGPLVSATSLMDPLQCLQWDLLSWGKSPATKICTEADILHQASLRLQILAIPTTPTHLTPCSSLLRWVSSLLSPTWAACMAKTTRTLRMKWSMTSTPTTKECLECKDTIPTKARTNSKTQAAK
jgi:hypothetical protein